MRPAELTYSKRWGWDSSPTPNCAAPVPADFDLRARRLQVRRQVQRESAAGVEIRLPKYGSERTVHLVDGLVSIVNAHLTRLPGRGPHRWLFHGENGNPPHRNTEGYWWRKTRTAAGHPTVELHGLRHFYASELISAGRDVVTVQRALGHSGATVTLNTYAHLWPTAEDRTRTAAASLLATWTRSSPRTTTSGACRTTRSRRSSRSPTAPRGNMR